MLDEPYKNRELDDKFKAADERADAFHEKLMDEISYIKEKVDAIEKQTKLTNGRVNKLEKWQSYVIGFCACLTVIVIPTAIAVLKHLI